MELLGNLKTKIVDKYENKKEMQLKIQECNKDKSLYINPTFGHAELGLQPPYIMRQKENGVVYFGINDSIKYTLVGYEWGGPVYHQVVSAQTNANANTNQESTVATVKKGKSGRVAAGAIIGTMLMPGVGTVVGAAIGASGKNKKNTASLSNTNTQSNANAEQISRNVEQDTTAIIRLKRISDNTIHSLTVMCNTEIDAQIRCFNIEKEKNIPDSPMNAAESLKEIKALKELLDMGAITQEEFALKKSQLLNI